MKLAPMANHSATTKRMTSRARKTTFTLSVRMTPLSPVTTICLDCPTFLNHSISQALGS